MTTKTAEIAVFATLSLLIAFVLSLVTCFLLELIAPAYVEYWWMVLAFMLFDCASIPAVFSNAYLDGHFSTSFRLVGFLTAVLGAILFVHSINAHSTVEILFASAMAVYALQPSLKKASG